MVKDNNAIFIKIEIVPPEAMSRMGIYFLQHNHILQEHRGRKMSQKQNRGCIGMRFITNIQAVKLKTGLIRKVGEWLYDTATQTYLSDQVCFKFYKKRK